MLPALYLNHSTVSSALSDICTAGGVRVVQQPESVSEGRVVRVVQQPESLSEGLVWAPSPSKGLGNSAGHGSDFGSRIFSIDHIFYQTVCLQSGAPAHVMTFVYISVLSALQLSTKIQRLYASYMSTFNTVQSIRDYVAVIHVHVLYLSVTNRYHWKD